MKSSVLRCHAADGSSFSSFEGARQREIRIFKAAKSRRIRVSWDESNSRYLQAEKTAAYHAKNVPKARLAHSLIYSKD